MQCVKSDGRRNTHILMYIFINDGTTFITKNMGFYSLVCLFLFSGKLT